MPTIHDFGGYKIVIYPDDHNPPHFHLIGPGWRAAFTIADRRHMKGKCPGKAVNAALAWAAENRTLLIAHWVELNERDD